MTAIPVWQELAVVVIAMHVLYSACRQSDRQDLGGFELNRHTGALKYLQSNLTLPKLVFSSTESFKLIRK